ncbi:DNA-primase RepB domain-containing protein [Salipiger mucosus]|uniref:DNA-primase RepB domain-containing protein n=1 Tax=Salipiger mucosus TaxID=263378 RepID=UPI001FDF2AE8|nr:DNA-primase RepB domain-containing protein [Salipiger mucosus]
MKTFASLCFRKKGSSRMVQEFVQLDDDMCVVDVLRSYSRHEWDQYFSPNVYTRKNRKLSSVFHTCWFGWCDVDEADPFAFNPEPSIVWQTSPGRTQALWVWGDPHTPETASAYSKALAYRYGGDKGGSAANKLLRIPGSYNHKPGYGKPFIPLLKFDFSEVSERPKLLPRQRGEYKANFFGRDLDPHAHSKMEVWKKYRRKLDASTSSLIRHNTVRAPDRSNRIFAMVAGLHEAGATLDEIASVIWASPYFRDKHGDNLSRLVREIHSIIGKVEDAR